MPKLKIDLDIAAEQSDNVHGWADKIGVVLHETVSGQRMRSLADIRAVSAFLDNEDYGIHGINDNDGYIAWALGLGGAVFYHTQSGSTGHANTNYCGIEQVSDVMVKYRSRAERVKAWAHMQPELNATAKMIACIARAHDFPIVSNNGNTNEPGITTHWEVSRYFHISGGHSDCWPYHLGGYYPKLQVIALAKRYYRLGWHF